MALPARPPRRLQRDRRSTSPQSARNFSLPWISTGSLTLCTPLPPCRTACSPPSVWHVNQESRDEIAASVAAHAELGARYDGAVAEGLVERIGEEIDRRVEGRPRGRSAPRGAEALARRRPHRGARPPAGEGAAR